MTFMSPSYNMLIAGLLLTTRLPPSPRKEYGDDEQNYGCKDKQGTA